MALAPGLRLGVYEVTAPIGEGGMGQVFRAHDTRLNRQVAIKVLPDSFANDPGRLARLTREAQTLASLNHPNIAAVYGLEDQSGVLALVMELVEGETLSQRLQRGAIPLDEALPIARQIAEALEAAHDQGIVHRDLKPANIQVRADGTVKVLDFGLAKASESGLPADSPAMTASTVTAAGMIMGTVAYMSPEQACGKPIDKRTDVWSFGVVLLEMLSGRRVFDGETTSDVLADVLRSPIDFTRIPANTPTTIRDLIRRCLNRDVKKRMRDIGEARLALDEAMQAPIPRAEAPPAARSNFPWPLVAGVLGVILIAALMMQLAPWRRAPVSDRELIRLETSLGPDALGPEVSQVAISPDGTRVVFPIRGADGKERLASRLLAQPAVTPLAGTEGGTSPFFSPDGQSIAFFADFKLKTVALGGGIPLVLSDVTSFRGASWGENGEIVASLFTIGGLRSIPLAGGAAKVITNLAPDEFLHLRPQVLPGGRAVLFTASPSSSTVEGAKIQAVTLSSEPGKTGEIKTLVNPGHDARYLPTNGSTGHLLYLHQGMLYAVAFDPARLEVSGTPVPMLEDVANAPRPEDDVFTVSRDGTFVYRSGRANDLTWPIVLMDATGKTEPLVKTPGAYSYPSFSRDGKRVALVVETGKGQEVFVYDIEKETMTRVTFTNSQKRGPVWSLDGAHLAFASAGPEGQRLNWIRADGSGETQVLLETKERLTSLVLSPDGKRLAYHDNTPNSTNSDIWTLPIDTTDPEHPKPGKPEPFLQTSAVEAGPNFSPDGRFVAYFSNESGRYEIYVKPAPGPDGKPGAATWQVSTTGGIYPVWSPNGRELYYRSKDRVMVADYSVTGNTFASSNVRPWSDRPTRTVGTFVSYAQAPDGKHFAVFPLPDAPAEAKSDTHVTFLLNFFDELRRRVPSAK